MSGEGGRPHREDDARFLAASEVRVTLLSRLSESPTEFSELGSGISRASLSRNVKYLKEKGWIRETEDGLSATSAGELALKSYRRLARSMETVDELKEFLNRISVSGAKRLDVESLRGADVVTPTKLRPMLPVERLLDLLEGTDRVRALLPHVLPSMRTSLREELERGMEMEVVMSRSLGDLMGEEVGGIAERFDARFHVLDGEVPFGLRLIDDTLTLMAGDDEGLPRALVVSDSPEAVRWGERRFEQALRRAEEL